MSYLVLKLVRGDNKTGSAAMFISATFLREVLSNSFTLSEEGIAGTLSYLAFLVLDFLATRCKREGESVLLGEGDAEVLTCAD